ncbi:hypothetical protein NUSPORA_00039 [Nucleospora cyclopteri]
MNRQVPKAYILTKNDPSQIQKSSAQAAKNICGMIRTCLGPRAMQKMVLTKINTVEVTNDGNCILRELDVGHPSARCLIDLAKTQDDECGDGTTSVIILAAELLDKLVPLISEFHPIKICKFLSEIRNLCIDTLHEISIENKESEMLKIVRSAVSTKLCTVLKLPIPEIAVEAAMKIRDPNSAVKCDIKNNIRIVKMLGDFKQSKVLDGILLEKDIIHSQMQRHISSPKILLIDSPLEYKKGESATNMEFSEVEDFTDALRGEERQIEKMVQQILNVKPDLVVSEKGISDLALSLFQQNNVTALRRVKKSDLTRIAKATGATIMNRLEDIDIKHLGSCGQFDYEKIGQTFYSSFHKCKDPKAISVILSGPTKDLNNELERNFFDAVKVAKNMIINSKMVPGGGASEMAILNKVKNMKGDTKLQKNVKNAVCEALKVIPSILALNSGVSNSIELLNILVERHKDPVNCYLGVNGITGEIQNMKEVVMEPIIVKSQCMKSAFDTVIQLLRVDGIIECKTVQESTD